MKVSLSLPEEIVKAVDHIVNQPDSPVRNRSNLIALAVEEFLVRNYPESYLKSTGRKIVKPTVLSYLRALPSERYKMRSPRLRGRRIHAEWIEIR